MTTDRLRGESVLILGGLGFIGSNLAAACVSAGASVTLFDGLHAQSGGNPANLDGLADQVRVVHDDIRNADAVTEAVRGQAIVFNCAALTSHPGSMRDPLGSIDVNCRGLLTVLEAMRQVNADAKFVQVGTSTQVGRMLHEPIDEQHAEFPVDIYSANKSAGEKYTLIYGQAYGLRTTVVRLANTYGPRAHIRTAQFGFINHFVGLALQGKVLSVYGEGAQRRNVSFVGDSVAAIIEAGTADAANGEVFFATADEQVTVREVAQAIAQSMGGSVQHVPWPADRAAIEIGDAVISNRKIRERLGWTPATSLADGLALTRDYFASRLEHYL